MASNVQTEKNLFLAYALWFFLGAFGVHRLYLGKIGTGITQLALLIIGSLTMVVGVGIFLLAALGLWWILDAYFTQAIVSEHNQLLA